MLAQISITEGEDPFVSPLEGASNHFHATKRMKRATCSEDEVRAISARRLRRSIFGIKTRNHRDRQAYQTPRLHCASRDTNNAGEVSPCSRVASRKDNHQRRVERTRSTTGREGTTPYKVTANLRRNIFGTATPNHLTREDWKNLLGPKLPQKRLNFDGVAQYSISDQKVHDLERTKNKRVSGTFAWWNTSR